MRMSSLKNNVIDMLWSFAEWLLGIRPIYALAEWHDRHRDTMRVILLIALTALLIFSILHGSSLELKAQAEAEDAEISQRAFAMLNTEPIATQAPVIPDQYVEEAETLARVIYGIRDNSEDDMRTHIWCIFNRVDIKTGEFAKTDTLEKAISKPGQWIFYETSYDYPVVESLYRLALEEVIVWHDGHRPCSADFVYEWWSPDEIVLRNTWEYGRSTKTWGYGR